MTWPCEHLPFCTYARLSAGHGLRGRGHEEDESEAASSDSRDGPAGAVQIAEVIKSLVLEQPIINRVSDSDGPWNFENPVRVWMQREVVNQFRSAPPKPGQECRVVLPAGSWEDLILQEHKLPQRGQAVPCEKSERAFIDARDLESKARRIIPY